MVHLQRSPNRHADYRGQDCALLSLALHYANQAFENPPAQRGGRTMLEFLRL